ncbi:discoidin domain-containing protein [Bacillus weihaiensis]|uniref:Uncharacterized protein n=1 Tax=Bacillus weihaiensis TaxID=1547283 RepID=A0A1L3MRK1_9BACI|nr:discoidin domain-containing protein [Bacillus weihaiensis]APH04963.1 hypothetical protein A9C19_09490 [Bacillus weihaiensis]
MVALVLSDNENASTWLETALKAANTNTVTKTYFNLLVFGVVLLVLCMPFSTLSAEEINYESYNGFTTSEEIQYDLGELYQVAYIKSAWSKGHLRQTWNSLLETEIYGSVEVEQEPTVDVKELPILPSNEVHPKLWFDSSEIEEVYEKRVDLIAFAKTITNKDGTYTKVSFDALNLKPGQTYFFAMKSNDEAGNESAISNLYNCDPTISSSPVDETYRGIWIQHFSEKYYDVRYSLEPITEENWDMATKVTGEMFMMEGNEEYRQTAIDALVRAFDGPIPGDDEYIGVTEAYEIRYSTKPIDDSNKYFFSSDGVYREGSQYYIYSHLNLLPGSGAISIDYKHSSSVDEVSPASISNLMLNDNVFTWGPRPHNHRSKPAWGLGTFLYHYKNVSNVDLFPTYKPAFIWEFSDQRVGGTVSANGNLDTYILQNENKEVQFMNESDTTPLHPDAKWGNLFQWRYQQTDTTPWGGEFGNNTGASYDDSMDINESTGYINRSVAFPNQEYFVISDQLYTKYLTYDPTVKPIKPTESATQFFNEGGNHNHFDHLSFIIHAENQMMASDTGYSQTIFRNHWNDEESARYLLFHGQADMDQGEFLNYREIPLFESTEKLTLTMDVSWNQASKAEDVPTPLSVGQVQEMTIANKDGTNGEFELFLHGGRGTMRGEGDFRQWTYSNDLYGSASKMASWILSNDAELTNVNFMQILIPLSIDAKIPTVTNLSDSLNEAVTNAEFSYIRQNGLVQQFAVKAWPVDFEQNKTPISKYSMNTDFFDFQNHNFTKGYVSSNSDQYTMKLLIPEGKEVEKVVFDGTVIEFTQEGNYSVVNLSVSNNKGWMPNVEDSFLRHNFSQMVAGEATGQGSGAVQLTWTASGDDGEKGQAAFGGLLDDPNLNKVDVSNVIASTHDGIKVGDELNNISLLSNIASAETEFAEDVTKPSTVMDLTVKSATHNSVSLSWSAPYPSTPGSTETMLVDGLENSRTYYFAESNDPGEQEKSSDQDNKLPATATKSYAYDWMFSELTDEQHDHIRATLAKEAEDAIVTAETARQKIETEDDLELAILALNVPENTIDGDFTTRWSSEAIDGIGQWDFSIHTSIDGENWTTVIDHELTSGMTEEFETYYIEKSARYIRIEGFGNTASGPSDSCEDDRLHGYYGEMARIAKYNAFVDDKGEITYVKGDAAEYEYVKAQKEGKLGETIEVYPNKTVSVENTAVKIALPKDLPRGTKVTIEKHDPSNPSGQAIVSQSAINSLEEVQKDDDHQEDQSRDVITGYDEEAYKSDEVAIYYFNETTEKWEHNADDYAEALWKSISESGYLGAELPTVAGDVYTFTFEFPPGMESYTGKYLLTLQGGEVKNGTITLEVNHFSTYGVFAAVQQNPGNQEESSDPVDQEDSNSQDEKEKSSYGDNERRTWYRTAEAHNTVTLNGSYLLIGFLLILGGAIVLFVRRKERKIEEKQARFIDIENNTSKGENPLLFPPDS